MRIHFFALVIVVLTLDHLHAARCKVDGEWYDYDLPECRQAPAEEDAESQSADSDEGSKSDIKLSEVDLHLVPNYLRPWEAVQSEVFDRCQERVRFANDAMTCRRQEEKAFWMMRGSYGLPGYLVDQIKVYCISEHRSFTGQAGCLEQEAYGYTWINGTYDLPDSVVTKLKSDCQEETPSFSGQAACLRREIWKIDKPVPNSHQSQRVFSRSVVTRTPEYPPPSQMVLFKVNPALDAPVARGGTPYGPSKPLQFYDRTDLIGLVPPPELISIDFLPWFTEQAEYFELKPVVPRIEGQGELVFHAPDMVDPERGALLKPAQQSRVVLRLFVNGGHRYLVDFAVNAWEPGQYRVNAESGEMDVEDADGKLGHVTVLLSAAGLGWTEITLSRPEGSGFYLNAVGVTAVELENPYLSGLE